MSHLYMFGDGAASPDLWEAAVLSAAGVRLAQLGA
jgi:hypothetical protein